MADQSPRRRSSLSRRQLLGGLSSVGAAAIAGCTRSTATEANDDSAAACGGLTGSVTVKGSSTVYPVSLAMSEEFKKKHPRANVSVDSTGTGGGFKNHFCTGNADINDASREIKESEIQQCSSNGIEPIKFQIAGDALTVAVNKKADWVDCLTFDELAQIWGSDGAQRWSDVRSEWPDKQIDFYGPASTSGTFDWFTSNVVGEERGHRSDYEATEKDNVIMQGIEESRHAIGYFGYAYYKENSDRVKAVEIKESEDGTCTPPSLDNAKDGSYPLARPLFIYVAKNALSRRTVSEFVRFYIEQAETELVKEIGYVPESQAQRDENLETLDAAIEDVA